MAPGAPKPARSGEIWADTLVAGGTLYVATMKKLYAFPVATA